ncbi:DUF4279 domain-containing protein [Chitinophaga sp. Hz27]|uniref:DUF4279 domain-containing protein n=1 Tax=Chitinophaga sp. Hz27 TaxID=3347169 RepID=UPI0035D6FAA8
MKNKIDLRLIFYTDGDMNHEEIESMIGIKPFRTYTKGLPKNSFVKVLAKSSAWHMEVSNNKETSFEDQLNALLDLIEAKYEVFESLCHRYSCEISCAVFLYFGNEESTPWIHLDQRFMDLCSKLKIEFDIDMYNWPDRE